MDLAPSSSSSSFIKDFCCPICLENDATVVAPCGFVNACFHLKCLERLKNMQGSNFRCPHCNILMRTPDDAIDEIDAIEKISVLLQTWLLTEESVSWVQKPIFVRVQNGMQRGEKESRVLRCVVARLVGKLKDIVKPLGGVRILTSFQNHNSNNNNNSNGNNSNSNSNNGNGNSRRGSFLHEKKFICRNISNTFEYSISLKRVAFIESMGRVSCDGYSISGKKSKLKLQARA